MGYNKALINITKLSGLAGRSFDIKSVLKYGGAFDRQIEKSTPIHSTKQENIGRYVVLMGCPHQDKVLEYTKIDLCICSRMRTAKFC